jgi:hypothetical protein
VEEMAGGAVVGSDEIVIDEEMLDDQDQGQEIMVPEPPKAMSTSSEIKREDDSPDSPGKPSSEADTEVTTAIDNGSLEVDTAPTSPEADIQKKLPLKLSSQSSHSSSGQDQENTHVSSNTDVGSVTDSDSEADEPDPWDDLLQDPEDPTQWYDKLMAEIDIAKRDDTEYFDYEFGTHRIGKSE